MGVMQNQLSSRYVRLCWWGLALLLFGLMVYTAIRVSAKSLRPRPDGFTEGALLRWSKQIQAMEDGENIHETKQYPNPPIMMQMLWPFSELDEKISPLAAVLSWFLVKVVLAFFCFYWTWRLLELDSSSLSQWPIAVGSGLTLILSIRPFMGDLTHGNVNILICFLVIASVYLYAKKYDYFSGVVIALAIACKVTPALFVVYYAWKRSWKVLIGTGVGLGLFFFVVPALIFAFHQGSFSEGWDQNWQALNSWVKTMILPYLRDGTITSEHHNQSLPGLLARLLSESPSFSRYINDVYTPMAYHNWLALDKLTIKRIVQLCQFLFLGLIIYTCRTQPLSPDAPRTGWRFTSEYALIALGMLLFSERTWKHHCTPLVLPYAVLIYIGVTHSFPKMMRRVSLGSALLAFSFTLLTSTFGNEKSKEELIYEFGKLAQVYGAYTWAFLLLIAALAYNLRKGSTASVG
jgi:hypothetical protein